MKVRMIAVALMMASFVTTGFAERKLWTGSEAYLGQTRPEDTPQVFAKGLLTSESGMFAMGRVAFSHDGREFYFTANDSWNSLEHGAIEVVRYEKHGWGKPEVVNKQFISPTLSMDGNVLYFRRGNMHNVWLSHKTSAGWSEPVEYLNTKFGVYDYMPTKSGRIYVGSDAGPEDAKNGSTYVYSVLTAPTAAEAAVKSLGRPLNGPGFNGDLFVAPDESYMIVSTNETPTYESELYIAFRNSDGTWAKPVSLGAKINDGLAHRWGQYVTPDGKYLFYTRGTSEKDCAVYWVRFDTLLESLRPKKG
jgi:hypothetical protein